MALPPEERLANLQHFARCTAMRYRRRPMSEEEADLRKLMPSSLGRDEDVWEYGTCAICLVDFGDGEELRRAPCNGGHVFHPKCLRGWYERSHATCPVCRGGAEGEDGDGTATRRLSRARDRPSPDALAEYVMRRLRSGKVDLTISASNHRRAARIVRAMREDVPACGMAEEADEEGADANKAVKPTRRALANGGMDAPLAAALVEKAKLAKAMLSAGSKEVESPRSCPRHRHRCTCEPLPPAVARR